MQRKSSPLHSVMDPVRARSHGETALCYRGVVHLNWPKSQRKVPTYVALSDIPTLLLDLYVISSVVAKDIRWDT